MSGYYGLVYVVYMLLEILYFRAILVWQAIASGIRYVYHCGTSLDDGFHHLREILVVCATSVFGIELHVLDILLGVSH